MGVIGQILGKIEWNFSNDFTKKLLTSALVKIEGSWRAFYKFKVRLNSIFRSIFRNIFPHFMIFQSWNGNKTSVPSVNRRHAFHFWFTAPTQKQLFFFNLTKKSLAPGRRAGWRIFWLFFNKCGIFQKNRLPHFFRPFLQCVFEKDIVSYIITHYYPHNVMCVCVHRVSHMDCLDTFFNKFQNF